MNELIEKIAAIAKQVAVYYPATVFHGNIMAKEETPELKERRLADIAEFSQKYAEKYSKSLGLKDNNQINKYKQKLEKRLQKRIKAYYVGQKAKNPFYLGGGGKVIGFPSKNELNDRA